MMNICILYYDGFCEFEVAVAASQFTSEHLIAGAAENKVYLSEEKQKYIPDKTIGELNPEEIDLLIIPGGNPQYLFENEILKKFVCALNEKKKIIAGICGGAELMAAYGLLDNKRCTGDGSGLRTDAPYSKFLKNAVIVDEELVVDGNIVTSMGRAYVDFGLKLGEIMKVYESKEEAEENYKWYKNIKE